MRFSVRDDRLDWPNEQSRELELQNSAGGHCEERPPAKEI